MYSAESHIYDLSTCIFPDVCNKARQSGIHLSYWFSSSNRLRSAGSCSKPLIRCAPWCSVRTVINAATGFCRGVAASLWRDWRAETVREWIRSWCEDKSIFWRKDLSRLQDTTETGFNVLNRKKSCCRIEAIVEKNKLFHDVLTQNWV